MWRGEYNVEYRVPRKDGQVVWVRDRAVSSYEKDGMVYGDGCVTEVTEEKSYAETIERLQQRTQLILNSAGEGILGLDPDGRFTFVNSAAARMLGFTADELVGRRLHGLIRHTRSDGTRCAASSCGVLRSIREGVAHRAGDDVFSSRRGVRFPVEFISTPKLEDGRLVGAVVVFRDITEARNAQERIAASLREKEALLREIHHRVKNNLQVVCSLLKLNSRHLRDPEARRIFEDTQHRVKAMALVHETLYRSGNLAGINFSDYIPRLAEQLLKAYGLSTRQVAVTTEVESAVLPIDIAIPCALILTELISNAAKHAFAVERRGQLRIVFGRRDGPMWRLEVENSAGGKPPEPAPGQGSSFGLELVKLLTEQLGGVSRVDHTEGFRVNVEFPAAGETQEK
jgi:PAS domain S-box-containing protein